MTPQLIKKAFLVLTALLATLILVNVFVFMPQLRREPVQPLVPDSEDQPGSIAKDNIMAVDTLKAIKEGKTADDRYALYTEEEFSRNPFFWPQEKAVPQKQIKKGKPEPKKPQLSMVIIGEHQKQALLDDVFVTEGSNFHGYRVKRIANRELVLEGDLGEIRITLASGRKDDRTKTETAEIGIIER